MSELFGIDRHGNHVPLTAEEIAEFNAPPVIREEDVRTEAARRLGLIFSARDRNHLERLISDATREAVRLLRKGEANWTAEEVARADYLTQSEAMVDAHDESSKSLRAMTPIPVDYTSDKYWPPLPTAV